ncbi:hypothetical protein [Ramlibacter sp.]|uniref:hypothetical protein n=1 Tax=Ramlibacter sp. TaxID=1917967 RepID=UPI002ED2D2CA
MDLRLRLLESFRATGSDGVSYKVMAYERLARDASFADDEHWEPTGQAEYRLADGRFVDVKRDGEMCIAGTTVVLSPDQVRATA